ncbi:MAG: ATP-binding protein [Pseudomonadota bacterium]
MTESPIRGRRWRRWPLSRQIATVLAGAVLMNAVLFVVTMTIFVSIEERRIEQTLSPAAARALKASEASRLPRTEDLAAYLRETRGMEDLVDERINTALALFTLLAATAGFALGYVLLGRLGRGLNNVAHAARRVAEGDLSAQASAPKWASREEFQLASDFNAMSRSLQRAERELAESTAAVAHELRTPLTILRGRLHGIEDGVFPGGPEEMRGLLFQVEGLGRLIDDLQTLNLAKSDRMLLDLVTIDLSEQVEHVLAVVRPDLEAAGLDPVLDMVSTMVVADGARLRQAISAVLNNAQRYAAQSGVLRIHTRIEDDDVVLEIVDHGPGLPPGTSELAFDRFWRAEGSRARHSGGTGLGLAIVRVIVEAHGGSATLESHDGGGTVFTMRLPRPGAGRST